MERPARSSASVESVENLLRFAITNRRLLELQYHGRIRVAEPHDYGVQKGIERLLAYQIREAGSAKRAGATGWRLFDLSKIEACRVLDETFAGSRGQSYSDHHAWEILYARVG